jgi:hypothetical protein
MARFATSGRSRRLKGSSLRQISMLRVTDKRIDVARAFLGGFPGIFWPSDR